jgi:hypothetical protein
MATVSENLGYVVGVYQLEITDPLEGGAGGIMNKAIIDLASRTKWLKDQLNNAGWLTGDVKEVDCTNDYISANFDATGLGINERVGWAICNGANGTRDRGGRVGMGYGNGYNTMGAVGGSKDAIVVSHTHKQYANTEVNINSNRQSNFPDRQPALRGVGEGSADHDYTMGASASTATHGNTSSAGSSGTDKNLQPYLVTLFIQKL